MGHIGVRAFEKLGVSFCGFLETTTSALTSEPSCSNDHLPYLRRCSYITQLKSGGAQIDPKPETPNPEFSTLMP